MLNRGTISTRPPIETVSSVRTSSRIAFFSIFSCQAKLIGPLQSFGRRRRDFGWRGQAGLDAHIAADRAPQVVGHDQGSGEEENAAESTDQIEGMHRGHGLDEGVLEEAELVVGPP